MRNPWFHHSKSVEERAGQSPPKRVASQERVYNRERKRGRERKKERKRLIDVSLSAALPKYL